MGEGGRILSKAKGAGFVARNWLENDGDAREQFHAASLWDDEMRVGDVTLHHLSGKRAAVGLEECSKDQWVILNTKAPDREWPCEVFDPVRLRKSGALGLYETEKGLVLVSAKDVSGARLWNTPQPRPRRKHTQ